MCRRFKHFCKTQTVWFCYAEYLSINCHWSPLLQVQRRALELLESSRMGVCSAQAGTSSFSLHEVIQTVPTFRPSAHYYLPTYVGRTPGLPIQWNTSRSSPGLLARDLRGDDVVHLAIFGWAPAGTLLICADVGRFGAPSASAQSFWQRSWGRRVGCGGSGRGSGTGSLVSNFAPCCGSRPLWCPMACSKAHSHCKTSRHGQAVRWSFMQFAMKSHLSTANIANDFSFAPRRCTYLSRLPAFRTFLRVNEYAHVQLKRRRHRFWNLGLIWCNSTHHIFELVVTSQRYLQL